MWANIFTDGTNYVEGSQGYVYHLAQQMFFQGRAAMMFSTDWIYNEILKYTDTGTFPDDFDIRLMNTPAASTAVDTHISYIVGEDNYFAIPKSSIKANLAKSFLKLMISDRGVEIFTNKAHGTMAYKTKNPIVTEDEYTNNLLSYLNNAPTRFTNWSDSKLFLKNQIDIWTDNNFKPYNRIFKKNPATVAEYMTQLSGYAKSMWNQWVTNAK